MDSVYTGKAMVGLIDLITRGKFDEKENMVFIHAGGTPTIFVHKMN